MAKKWFWIGMSGVFLLSLILRFWGLDRFNTLVFDEVYYAKFGNDYLKHHPFFDGHPPLGKLIIALGIWISTHVPFFQGEVNGFTGSLLSPLNYRWINAFSGSFIPLIVAAIAYHLSYRRSFALLAGLFTACDGIFLVESRYALINQYIVIFGLLGQWFFLLALASRRNRRTFWLILAGIAFGASTATKWNGLWYLLGAYVIWLLAWAKNLVTDNQKDLTNQLETASDTKLIVQSPLQNLTQINIWQILFYLGIIPFIIYSIIWIPHLLLDTRYGFIEVHKQILAFHERLGGNTPKVHPYCAEWYKWPLMIRPMAYFYGTTQSINAPPPVMGPPLPSGTGKIVYDVHAMGNPFLWWFAVAALLFLIGMLISQLVVPSVKEKGFSLPTKFSVDTWIALYLVVNYFVHLLPWVTVTRCVFIYHYMTGVVFAFLAIAWLVDQALSSYYKELRVFGITITFLVLFAFVFWMPIYLGLPLSTQAYHSRIMWMGIKSWI
ncbi:phospholipid carrier-dependent glycosyltransferase [Aetokthonos hydrillicola Thurmond2011]|jgi:dolichyl-phosphate-mannose--protein O-mannosyl transferase|uniref:Polyprenol-phosphate-mannose--protein mannosyltransferase n=1 Tax=Aetokthonos hydrillicola Thurmond2011 TaxID=2712845 RepID=A0AAP5M4H3_9CYAN|nr:phospholipid carrier-dependent glycosyltransferase [Aetokthonos hydrillicola]MBO3463800.1 phospholipid carrier-dependent glycosyltransferase [Aetokthonos hydrillicola CCALA 1050]MBW4590086.1 phospholipid carrier-dependent glycosyltransferase [Aetokthonos hydrillicola CCALA 1050]MDR9894861.1 phospholipid carrier-dependent glycosyltransferase [Aetokthonos hydrillicola Thurmond2011]